jgi:3'-phosphoadenosine 5'-phosphosulfate sulfotransferase (PAPS reductase)/FAD synthetase
MCAMNIIFTNYGNDSIALIQWARDQGLEDLWVVNVDTGWASPCWPPRVLSCQEWLDGLKIKNITIKPKKGFTAMVRDRGAFPNSQFQWCVTFLKALPFLEWLDKVDPSCEATIVLPRRRCASEINFDLPELVEASEHYNDRKLWHPLYQHTDTQVDALIAQTPFEKLPHRALECDPCIHSNPADMLNMDEPIKARTAALEKEIGKTVVNPKYYGGAPNIEDAWTHIQTEGKKSGCSGCSFDVGCGHQYGCGL